MVSGCVFCRERTFHKKLGFFHKKPDFGMKQLIFTKMVVFGWSSRHFAPWRRNTSIPCGLLMVWDADSEKKCGFYVKHQYFHETPSFSRISYYYREKMDNSSEIMNLRETHLRNHQ